MTRSTLQASKGLFGNSFFILLCLEVTARDQSDQILQLATPELGSESHAQHVCVGRVVDVIVDIL